MIKKKPRSKIRPIEIIMIVIMIIVIVMVSIMLLTRAEKQEYDGTVMNNGKVSIDGMTVDPWTRFYSIRYSGFHTVIVCVDIKTGEASFHEVTK